ncbi:MAG: hypothetical protein H7A36_03145 [Chlamydiales bacterium]|nr:hypothetical protein [Chlamydiales bacterium]
MLGVHKQVGSKNFWGFCLKLSDLECRQYKWYGKREIGQIEAKSAKKSSKHDVLEKLINA